MRATVAGGSPPSTRGTGRRRRRSSSAAVPIGRVMFHYTDVQSGIQALAVLISVRRGTPETAGGPTTGALAGATVTVLPAARSGLPAMRSPANGCTSAGAGDGD